MFIRGIVLMLVLIAFGCREKKKGNPSYDFQKGKRLRELTDSKMSELSGLAASANNPGYLWTHNDGGSGSEFFMVDAKLNIKLKCKLAGIENRDWEDIAVGPGPDSAKNYLYIGEIGDNEAIYPLKYIYRFEEPILQTSVEEITITKFDTITFRLSDKQKDTESLMIDPMTKDLYILSKREEPVYVYELKYPYSTTDTITVSPIVSLPLTQIVAGDISVDGKEILLKNYNHIYYWSNFSNKPLAEVFKSKPQEIPYEVEPQGESIAWARDGSGFYTISEMNNGKKSFLYFYQRK